MTGIQLINEERKRQIEQEGWTAELDDLHTDGELAEAAAAYAASCNLSTQLPEMVDGNEVPRKVTVLRHTRWPFDWDSFKPTPEDRIKELSKAGALIAAEIDRIARIKIKALEDSLKLTKSGYAGINKEGQKVDRREFPDAVPMQENPSLGIPKPKNV